MASRRPRSAGSDGARKPFVTTGALVSAALELVENEGLEALSMRRLAEQLGVQAASLYWHVQSKEQVLDLLADALLARASADAMPVSLALAVDGRIPWTDAIREVATAYRSFLRSHRDAARIIAGRFVGGIHLAHILEPILAVLRAGGLDAHDAAYSVYMIIVYVQGFVLHENAPLSASNAEGTEREDALLGVQSAIKALPTEEFPYLAESSDTLTEANLDERFRFGLDRIIDGLAAHAGA